MDTNQDQVKRIIEYLQGKISNLREKLKAYDSPMMQEMAKNSPHLQMDYIRISAELQANEDNLLAIQKFSDVPAPVKPEKVKRKNQKKPPTANTNEQKG